MTKMNIRRRLKRIGTSLIYGGSSYLRDYEIAILDKLRDELNSDEDRRAITSQITSLDHVKRLHHDKMVTFHFYDAPNVPLLRNSSADCRLTAFRVRATTLTLTVVIVVHEGLLSSLEFSKSPIALRSASIEISRSQELKDRLPTLTDEIDASEHGGTKLA